MVFFMFIFTDLIYLLTKFVGLPDKTMSMPIDLHPIPIQPNQLAAYATPVSRQVLVNVLATVNHNS